MQEVVHGPTRGERKIDRFLTNFSRAVLESDTLPPLDDGLGRESDHLISYFKADVAERKSKRIKYSYHHYTDEGAVKFQAWISAHSFEGVFELGDVNEQVEEFMRVLGQAMDICFPYKTTWRREKDPPWINKAVKRLIKKRRKLYHREGRSNKWRELKKKAADLIKTRAARYWEHQKRNLLQADASRAFYKNVKAYNSREKPAQFDIRSIFEAGEPDEAIAEKLADHFSGISDEFDGISPDEIPSTYSAPIPLLTPDQVARQLKTFRKPKSMVKHDIFPSLVNAAAPFLSVPLCSIYNNMTNTKSWPLKWKEEFLTPIPKKPVPEDVNDLRNISCTALFSKIYESFVLEWMVEQVGMRENQMGGMKGAGTEHYLVHLWQTVLETLEDQRAASLITSIDYAKAFNRLDFGHCLRALAAKGASTELIGIVASFLTSRTMSVKVGQIASRPRVVLGESLRDPYWASTCSTRQLTPSSKGLRTSIVTGSLEVAKGVLPPT